MNLAKPAKAEATVLTMPVKEARSWACGVLHSIVQLYLLAKAEVPIEILSIGQPRRW